MTARTYLLSAVFLAVIFPSTSLAIPAVHFNVDYDSGPGRFALYAATTLGDNAGLASYSVPLVGNLLTVDHRSPNAFANNFFFTGFAATGSRSSDLTTPVSSTIVRASQDVTYAPVSNLLYGIGQQASSFAAQGITLLALPDGSSDVAWSAPILLARGTYTGHMPSIDLFSPDLSATVFSGQGARETISAAPYGCRANIPGCHFAIDDVEINNVNAFSPGFVSHTLTGSIYNGVYHYAVDISLESFVPAPGSAGTGSATHPTYNGYTHEFRWNTLGSSLGTYRWRLIIDHPFYSTTGFNYLTIHITDVPEPALPTLLSMAAFTTLALFRPRRTTHATALEPSSAALPQAH